MRGHRANQSAHRGEGLLPQVGAGLAFLPRPAPISRSRRSLPAVAGGGGRGGEGGGASSRVAAAAAAAASEPLPAAVGALAMGSSALDLDKHGLALLAAKSDVVNGRAAASW